MASVPSFECAVCMTRYSMVLVAQLTHFRSVTLALVFFLIFIVSMRLHVCVRVCVR